MRGISTRRVPLLAFGAGIAAALAFGASSAAAAPGKEAANSYFCGFTVSEDACQQCCRGDQAYWMGAECYCESW